MRTLMIFQFIHYDVSGEDDDGDNVLNKDHNIALHHILQSHYMTLHDMIMSFDGTTSYRIIYHPISSSHHITKHYIIPPHISS